MATKHIQTIYDKFGNEIHPGDIILVHYYNWTGLVIGKVQRMTANTVWFEITDAGLSTSEPPPQWFKRASFRHTGQLRKGFMKLGGS